MKRSPADLILQWRNRRPDGQEAEDRAAALIRGSLQPGEPSEAQLARIEQRLLAWRQRASLAPLRLRLALAIAVLLVGGTSVEAARRMGWLDRILPALSPTQVRAPQSRLPDRARGALRLAPVEADGPAPVPAPAPIPAVENPAAEGERPQHPTRISRRTAFLDRPEPVIAAPSEEISALDHAIRLLRRDHDAGAALSALDAYLDRYPSGVLNREARFARVDALLILQRSEQALDALEVLPLDNHRRSTELQVIRGELRARSDCARAGQDFGAVLTRNPDDALAERALYGRGACRAKQGDVTGAAEDLRRYLERFPNGTHAGWARRWLESRGKAAASGG